ncbi:MAG TPA: hypothetical protein VK470_13960, partial [Bacteroidota bacterium]|nr:hypothetical protein [Bacteroidota bacterium]
GAASRTGAPPISLQAIWTADNGKLPPWKGDFHSDLNTQLSYWPAYSGNHLEEGAVFTDWLWEHRSEFSAYARRVFGADGLNVPGVATLDGQPMGGWHMYAMSPTVASWLAQNFYLQWRYSMDRDFLLKRAYPWVSDAARFIEQVTKVGADGTRALPMSSSPEFNDGGIEAWFLEMTNYDRALCRYVFRTAAELAGEAGKAEEQSHWLMREKEISPFDIDAETGLTIAKNVPYVKSHRHFSHLMAIHPLGLLNYDAPADRRVIETSVANLEKNGSSEWKGYSFSWLGNIYARMHEGEKAADALRTFARCYCSENSFHLNEDLCKRRPDQSTHLPFTLEGNFAFASGIQEMLLQSHAGYIDVFPALPRTWTDVAFTRLRAEGAILVSAVQRSGETVSVALESERGGEARIKLPFTKYTITDIKKAKAGTAADGFLTIVFEPGGTAELSRAAQ